MGLYVLVVIVDADQAMHGQEFLESVEKRAENAKRRATGGDKEAKALASVLGQALELLKEGKPARLTEPVSA